MSDDKEKWVGDPESAGYHCNCKPTSPLKCGDENKCNCKLNEVKYGTPFATKIPPRVCVYKIDSLNDFVIDFTIDCVNDFIID